MSSTTDGRQTVLPEYTAGFPYRFSSGTGKTHFVHETDVVGGATGKTYCGRFRVKCSYPRDSLTVLSAARNPCALCLARVDDATLETVALMASACSHHEITTDDIKATND